MPSLIRRTAAGLKARTAVGVMGGLPDMAGTSPPVLLLVVCRWLAESMYRDIACARRLVFVCVPRQLHVTLSARPEYSSVA